MTSSWVRIGGNSPKVCGLKPLQPVTDSEIAMSAAVAAVMSEERMGKVPFVFES